MKPSAKQIEKSFFDFIEKNGVSPSRKEMVDALGIPGNELLEILGPYSENIESTWGLNLKEREMLGKIIMENDKSFRSILKNICFLPAWSAQSKVVIKHGETDYIIESPTASKLAKHKGIAVFEVNQWIDASGHATVWDGVNCSDRCYFTEAKRVYIWILKN